MIVPSRAYASSALLAVLLVAAPAAAQTPASPPAVPPQGCETFPNFRLFDFWIGDWNVETRGGQPAGKSSVERVSGGSEAGGGFGQDDQHDQVGRFTPKVPKSR